MLERVEDVKETIVQVIKLIVTKRIYYNFDEDKQKQALALKCVIRGIGEMGKFTKLYTYAIKSGLKIHELELLKDGASDCNIEQESMFFGIISSDYKKMDMYTTNSNSQICHSIHLSPEEFSTFKENLSKDQSFGQNSIDVMTKFPGFDTFSATAFLPYNVIFEKLIPKTILDTYSLMKKGETNLEVIDKYINIENLSIGFG